MRRIVIVVTAVAGVAAILAYLFVVRDATPESPPELPQTTRARARLAELRNQLPGSIAGTVTANGTGVANATACARPSRDGLAHCATTDARGAYTIANLEPGAYVAWASAATVGGAQYAGELRVATDRATTGVDIALVAGAVPVRGVVRDVRGRAIAAAVVHVGGDARSPPSFTATTAGDGGFVAWAKPGEIYVAASADGFVDGDARGVAPSETIALALVPESTLSGVVIEAGTRRPLDDATVDVGGTSARTDATGRFRVTKLSPGRYKPTATSIGGYGEAGESVLLELGRSRDDIVIEVHPVAVVVGRVVIDEGTTTKPCPPDRGEVWLTRYGGRGIYVARTTDNGDVLLEGVVPGTYDVRVACSGWLPLLPYPDLVVASSDVEDLEWRVTPGARITGRVVSRTGAPIAEALVRLRSSTSYGNVHTGSDGRFVVDGVASGPNEVDARADGFSGGESQTVVAAFDRVATVELVLDPGGAIAGEVTDETGKPISAAVEVHGPSGGGDTSGADGRFTIDSLAAGDYDVVVSTGWDPEPKRRRVATTVTTGSTSHVRVVAETLTGEITGIVVGATGAPITDAYVSAARERDNPDNEPAYRMRGSWHSPAVLTGLDGRFRLTGLPRGQFALRAARAGGIDVVVDHVALGDHATLTMRPTGVLAGVVVGANIADVLVSADDRTRQVSREERLFHTGGRFAIRDLPAGTYRLLVDDDPRSIVTVTLAEGERREDVRLVAQPRFTVRGRLVGADGRPLKGYTVEAPRIEREEHSGDRHLVVSTTEMSITGADGRFLLRNLPSGPLPISAGDLTRVDGKLVEIKQITLQGVTAVELGDVRFPATPPQ